MPTKQRASIRIEVTGLNRFRAAIKNLDNMQSASFRTAMEDIGHDLEREVRARAPGRMSQETSFAKLTGSGARTRALVIVDHPGATSMEFGRHFAKHRPLPRGQKARPFAGVVDGDEAVGAVMPQAKEKLWQAIKDDFDAAFAGPDDAS